MHDKTFVKYSAFVYTWVINYPEVVKLEDPFVLRLYTRYFLCSMLENISITIKE